MTTASTGVPAPREVLSRLHELTISDAAASVDLYAEDGAHELPLAPAGMPGRIEGREAIRQMMNAAQAAGPAPVRYEGFDKVVVWETTDPEVIITEYEVVGTIAASGKQFRLPNLMLLRVRDGKILLTRSYFSPAALATLMKSG